MSLRQSWSERTSGSRFCLGFLIFLREERPLAAERFLIEEFHAGEQWFKSSFGNAQFVPDVKQVLLDLPLAELIGRDHVIGRQLLDGLQIAGAGSWRESCELQIFGHTFA